MPWCKKAEKLLTILEKLSAYFMTARLRVAKYDTTANENAGVPINNLTLKLFTRKGVKSGIVVKYHPDEAKTLESLKNFLKSIRLSIALLSQLRRLRPKRSRKRLKLWITLH